MDSQQLQWIKTHLEIEVEKWIMLGVMSGVSMDVFIRFDTFPMPTLGHNLLWIQADYSSWGSMLQSWQSLLSSLQVVTIRHSTDTFSGAYFVAMCHHYACSQTDAQTPSPLISPFPEFATVPHISLVAFSAKQGRRTRCIFARIVSTWQPHQVVTAMKAPGRCQMMSKHLPCNFSSNLTNSFWFQNFLFFSLSLFCLSPPPLTSASHSSHW